MHKQMRWQQKDEIHKKSQIEMTERNIRDEFFWFAHQ